tara:strand:+ start:2056 stop:2775 length:720 start_codon:yes stop_codon:yes gene_type:complete
MSEITELSKHINKSLKEEPLISCNQACSNFDCKLNINTATRTKAISLANYASSNVHHSLPQHSVVNLASNLAIKNSTFEDFKDTKGCLGYNEGNSSSVFLNARSKLSRLLFVVSGVPDHIRGVLKGSAGELLFVRFKTSSLKLKSRKGKSRVEHPAYTVAHVRNKIFGIDVAIRPNKRNEDYYVIRSDDPLLNKAAKAGDLVDISEDLFTINRASIRSHSILAEKENLNDFIKLGQRYR